jgi:hypothetical protein
VADWKIFVASHLRGDLGVNVREEVVAELAGHLEDRYEQLLAQGMIEADARRVVLDETPDWRELIENIGRSRHQEDAMNQRTKIFWLPGLAALTTASVLLMLLQRLVMLHPAVLPALWRTIPLRPTLWWKNQVDVIYLCWWMLLPLCGAAGAYMSRRAGGTRSACILASLFPSIVMLCIFCFVLPVSLVIDRNSFVVRHPIYFAIALVNWTMVPGLASILGALPFLRQIVKIQPR